jgi:RNA polymerase sigma-70 factor (ECF subfamily)
MSIFFFSPAPSWRTVAPVTRTERNDEAWLEALRSNASSGPAASHADVVADLRDFLRRTLAKGFGQKLTPEDLEDLAQESLLRVHGKLDTFQGQSRFTTWAATIAVNCTLSELRRRRYRHLSIEEAGEQADWSPSDGDEPVDEEQIALMRRGIVEALTDKQREAIQAALGGLPLMELARRWDVSQGAVYKLLHDARRRLKVYMETMSGTGAPQARGCAS